MPDVFEAMDFLNKYFATKDDGMQSFKACLDAHGVSSRIATYAIQDDAATRVGYPVSIPLEVAASV